MSGFGGGALSSSAIVCSVVWLQILVRDRIRRATSLLNAKTYLRHILLLLPEDDRDNFMDRPKILVKSGQTESKTFSGWLGPFLYVDLLSIKIQKTNISRVFLFASSVLCVICWSDSVSWSHHRLRIETRLRCWIFVYLCCVRWIV